MFYESKTDRALRFGDVLKGFISTTPIIREPMIEEKDNEYHINVNMTKFSVVMDPCCSIGDKKISLTPLIHLLPTSFNNPYLSEDLTRINREMEPHQAVPPNIWEKFTSEEKQKRLEIGKGYAFLNFFVYEGHDFLPKYTVNRREGNIETNYYMIDFRNMYKVNCDKIVSPTEAPLECKILQVSIDARSQLRDKISYYYGRVPEEDIYL